MPHRTYADIPVGEHIDCGTTSVSEDDIVDFAERFDPLGIHVDPDVAAASHFGGLIASSIHTFALTQPPVVEHFYTESDLVAAANIEEFRLPNPVRPGDTLSVTLDIEDKRPSERNDHRGVVTTRRRATVDGRAVLTLRNHTVWER
jgi:acyl dehydratase